MENLWPSTIAAEIPRSPLVIMREQASALGEVTGNALNATVTSRNDPLDPRTFVHSFYIVAPALQRYRYQLFTVSHDVASLYPIKVGFSEFGEAMRVARDEESFRDVVRAILAAETTQRIVRTLLAQTAALSDVPKVGSLVRARAQVANAAEQDAEAAVAPPTATPRRVRPGGPSIG